MGNYDDIINLPHHVSKRHPQMSMYNRAAQFAPFAALTGYDDAISESGRQTDSWVDMGDIGNEALNLQMALLMERLPRQPLVTIDYFEPDPHKTGGSYQRITGNARRIDEIARYVELTDGTKIAIDRITAIVF